MLPINVSLSKNKRSYHHNDNIVVLDDSNLENILRGDVLSSSIYPIIFQSFPDNINSNYYRSLSFYKLLTQHKYNIFLKTENNVNVMYFLYGLRDGTFNYPEYKEVFQKCISFIDPDDIKDYTIINNNIVCSPFPSKVHKLMRFIEFDENYKHFILTKSNHLLCFIDPTQLSYDNIENIVDVEKFINVNNLLIEPKSVKKNKIYSEFTLSINKSLLDLNNIGLYTEPLNKSSRGGKRFIFKSSKLSSVLTNELKKNVINSFEFVNHVFRYNNFEPSDMKFVSHMDTPYSDKQNSLYSKYTLIIYLTSGEANPVLKIQNENINKIHEFQCILFDQKYEHEGNPFISGNKIFIRTELIGKYKNVEHNDDVAKMFNIACYMSKESIFNEELSKYSNDCFNQAAKMRINNNITNKIVTHFLFKEMYLTNGNDYWFKSEMDLKDCVYLMLKDYFGKSSYKVINVTDDIKLMIDIYTYVNINVRKTKIKKDKLEYEIDSDDENTHCCNYHCYENFDPENCPDVVDECNNQNMKIINKYSLIIFGKEVYIHDNIVIDDKYIIVNDKIPKVNFASCWNSEYMDVNYISKNNAECINIPKIPYVTEHKCHHLKMDMFNNGFIRSDNIFEIIDDPISDSDINSDSE